MEYLMLGRCSVRRNEAMSRIALRHRHQIMRVMPIVEI